ncbi:hypothetical protein [Falsiroseomonas oryzae]|uniref:hypothetical protein n=1 Tax=Falsiroseomonas oryzae TaxID=2766473 RepID=UPI0022EB9993|nr:hypothetical protein [Roseomonas sp. MO-31]
MAALESTWPHFAVASRPRLDQYLVPIGNDPPGRSAGQARRSTRMPNVAYNQSDDPRWRSFASTRSGVCMALSAHFVIKALRGEDFWAWLSPPSGRDGGALRVLAGATRQSCVQDVRFLYDHHTKLKTLHGDGYQAVENNFLKDYIATLGGRISGQLVQARPDHALPLRVLPQEIGRMLAGGNAVYASWASLKLNGAHAISAVPGPGGRFRFFEPVLGEREHASVGALASDILTATMQTHGIVEIDRYLLMSFSM